MVLRNQYDNVLYVPLSALRMDAGARSEAKIYVVKAENVMEE